MMSTPKEKMDNAFNHRAGPIPWVEIVVDETIMSKILGREVRSWQDRVDFARQVGLAALGIYHWERYGSHKDESREVLHHYPLIKERSDLEKLRIPPVDEDAIISEVKEAKRAIGDSGITLFCEFAFCLDQTIADMGFENFCLKLYDDPEFVREMLGRYAAHIGNLIDLYNRLPEIDFVWIGDDLAYKAGLFVSPALFRRHILPFFQSLAERIRKPWVYHSDGNISEVLNDILALGPTALHPIEPDAMDIYQLKRDIGDKVCLIGNLDVDLIARGSEEEVCREVARLLGICGKGGGYAFSSGNAITKYAKLENVLAIARTIKEYNDTHYQSPVAQSR